VEQSVTYEIRGTVAVVTIDNPPVNALSHHVRVALGRTFETLNRDDAVQAIVLACAGKSFSAGADVRELGARPTSPAMGEIMRQIDASRPILVAAIHGQALGGGLELALLCDYRVAASDARLGLPEINLGLMPGGGGTQRLPRLVGIGPALDMIVSGKPVNARDAMGMGLIDVIANGDLVEAAVVLARRYSGTLGGYRRLSNQPLDANGFDFVRRRAEAVKSSGLQAGGRAVDAVEAATRLDFEQGLVREGELFQLSRESTESAALRYLFAGEREVRRVPGAGTSRDVARTAVVGAGTMGTGVTLALLDAGFPVTLVEAAQAGLDRGVTNIRKTYDSLVERGRLSAAQRDERLARLTPTLALEDTASVALVIECVFENMAVKQDLFRKLGALLPPGAVLATNTSALDVNAIADASGRPADVVGMHFFSPANIMKLVEVVNAAQTAPDVLATAMAVARKMGKIGVVSGVCDGFIGNRMIGGYLRQANLLLLEGAAPEQIDNALKAYGMAMGPHAMGDMAGLDIQAASRVRRRAEGKIPADDHFGAVADRLVANGRLGLKSGKGMYRYEQGSRTPLPDPEVDELIVAEAARLGITRRPFSDEEIIARCILPLVNEGARNLEEKIALGPVDIDVVYCNGYGFPRRRGGPMFYADTLGLTEVLAQIRRFRASLDPRHWTAAPLLVRLVEEGKSFRDLPRGQ
jgi:3-hydroxyacyl-CoA dehydrogenase